MQGSFKGYRWKKQAAARLASPGDVLMVGERIETCLAATQATGQPVWAALSTSGLRTLDLPDAVHRRQVA